MIELHNIERHLNLKKKLQNYRKKMYSMIVLFVCLFVKYQYIVVVDMQVMEKQKSLKQVD